MRKSEFLQFRIEPAEKKRLATEAKGRGLALVELMREKISNDVYFSDARIREYLDALQGELNLSRSQLIEAIVIKYWAQQIARKKTGEISHYFEFTRTDEGPLLGKELYDCLVPIYTEDLERDHKEYKQRTEELKIYRKKLKAATDQIAALIAELDQLKATPTRR